MHAEPDVLHAMLDAVLASHNPDLTIPLTFVLEISFSRLKPVNSENENSSNDET